MSTCTLEARGKKPVYNDQPQTNVISSECPSRRDKFMPLGKKIAPGEQAPFSVPGQNGTNSRLGLMFF